MGGRGALVYRLHCFHSKFSFVAPQRDNVYSYKCFLVEREGSSPWKDGSEKMSPAAPRAREDVRRGQLEMLEFILSPQGH